jgi:hypothetical protein
MDGSRHFVEVEACGPDDPDGRHAASLLAAYLDMEHAKAFRRLLWRRVAVGAGAAGLIEVTTSFFSPAEFFVVWLILGATALIGVVAEWRAEQALSSLVESHALTHTRT